MLNMRDISKMKKTAWEILRSPRTVALLKLGAAVIGVIHAIDELRESPGAKKQIGFHMDEDV
jgi:hypothetical protein